LFSAFFAGIEIAFISANKLLIELKNKQGSYYARILSPFIANPSKFIGLGDQTQEATEILQSSQSVES
jgi:Mg2+/Co2+ transporter CorB